MILSWTFGSWNNEKTSRSIPDPSTTIKIGFFCTDISRLFSKILKNSISILGWWARNKKQEIEFENFEFVKLCALRAFVPYVSSHLSALAPSYLTCLRALRALICPRLNYTPYVPYLLFTRLTHSRCKISYSRHFLNLLKGNLKGAVFEI